jgi:peptide deformylase
MGKGLNDILLLGDPGLYRVSDQVFRSELKLVPEWIAELHQAMEEIREKYHFGRAIAAPQLRIMKRIIYVNIDHPQVIINPRFSHLSPEMIDVWDDCMSFPNLLVKVRRHKTVILEYVDENWGKKTWNAEDELSELLQHEYDHLDGILATMRAIDERSFRWRK